MATNNLIPRPDGEFDSFQSGFMSAINANAADWKIPSDDITVLTPLQEAWKTDWAIAKNKKNCTTAQRKAKDSSRKAYEKELRVFIKKWVYLNKNMDAKAIEMCGLTPHDTTRTKNPVPTTLPLVDVVMGKGNVLQIIFRQQLNEPGSSRRGKPKGVAFCQFFYMIGTKPANPEDCTKFTQSSRSPIKVQLPSGLGGQTVWFYARWLNQLNEGGPWTVLDSFVIPF